MPAMEQTRREFVVAAAMAGVAANFLTSTSSGAATENSTALHYRSAKALVAALARREISSAELTQHTIKRIEALDASINAVVVRDFDRARAAAREADAGLARGELRPLLGLPMTVKEAFNVAGLPTTWGIPAFKGWQAEGDAVAVARLKDAGAIILGKTNVAVGLADWQSYNDVYGTTNNPWDIARTPGGSSGGAAAALAAGYVSLEIGSDLGGSIRAPAHFSGVFGHKSSYGIVPMRGHQLPGTEASGGDGELAVLGPMARTADDLALALDILAGPDDSDAKAYRLDLPPPRHQNLEEFRVLVIDTHPLMPTSEDVCMALDRLADRLSSRVAKIARSSPLLPDLAEAARIYMPMLVTFTPRGNRPRMSAKWRLQWPRCQPTTTALPPSVCGARF